jgi:hypothetical protein
MIEAVCLRCGAEKSDFDVVCGACGHRPEGEGLLVAWLLSRHHLSAEQLTRASLRIRQGEALRPSDAQLDKARKSLGRDASSDRGLDGLQRGGLLATSFLLTPLVGLTLWWWWRDDRPRSSFQAFWLSAPVSVLYMMAVTGRILGFV